MQMLNAKEKKRPASATKSDSSKTVKRILDAALQVLVDNGSAAFSMRLVATTAGMSPGNLTYHFPTKNELLRSLISRLLESYLQQFGNLLCNPEDPIEKQVEILVHWVVMENVDEETVKISREIWAMALHDDAIRDMVDDFYDDLIENIVTMLTRSRPDMDRGKASELIHFLVLIAEGTSVLFGTRRARNVSIERMIEVASRILGKIP